MAGLVEELVSIMNQETALYDRILGLNKSKRDAITNRDAANLEQITAKEEGFMFSLQELEKQRIRALSDMATVLGRDGETISVNNVIEILSDNHEEQEALSLARKNLIEKAKELRFWNDQNQELLKVALEMVDFDLTLFKGLKQAPETGNYNNKAYNTGDLLGSSGFDAKQ
ncbi:MAG: flagellar protein FlgN [Lachnospiraceae bacterium]|nr:flagellar protein FlgN [Lachnospiraceae bacterium]